MVAHIITLAQQKGGAGKTTLAAHLAVAFAEFGLKVGLIDTDPQASLAEWHRIRQRTLGENNNLALEQVVGWRVTQAIDRMKAHHDILIIDSPPRTETEARHTIRHADLVVVPLQPSPMDLWATHATLAIAAEERSKVKMILNRVSMNVRLADTIREQLEGLSPNEIGNRVIFAATLLEGKGVNEVAPFSRAGQEIEALAEELLGEFGMALVEEAEAVA